MSEKYFDVYFEVRDCNGNYEYGYSVFVKACDENEAIETITNKHLYEESEDLNNIKAITEITKEQFEIATN